jgi:hypothetical protein
VTTSFSRFGKFSAIALSNMFSLSLACTSSPSIPKADFKQKLDETKNIMKIAILPKSTTDST